MIDNKWNPLKPGMQFTTTGEVKSADGSVSAHSVVHTVTGLTKVIHGVKTLVLWDRDYSDGVLAESELAFFAQSKRTGQRLALRGIPGGVRERQAGGRTEHLHQRNR